jgi:hypothetical protein
MPALHRHAKSLVVIAALLACLAGRAGVAAAQPGMMPFAQPDPTAPPAAQDEQVSEAAALWLSLGITSASWALLAATTLGEHNDPDGASALFFFGTYLGPTAGHWYAGSYVSRGLGLRTLGIAASLAAIVPDLGCESVSCEGVPWYFWAGLLLYAGGTIDDIITAPRKARKRNEELSRLSFAPVVTQHSTGLALSGRF